jgi:hypothetical protein
MCGISGLFGWPTSSAKQRLGATADQCIHDGTPTMQAVNFTRTRINMLHYSVPRDYVGDLSQGCDGTDIFRKALYYDYIQNIGR